MSTVTRTEKILQKFGLNLCEYFILCSVDYRIGVGPKKLAKHSHWASEGDPRGSCTIEEHRAAVKTCINRKMLTILSKKYIEAEIKRIKNFTIPGPYNYGLRIGAVDFTQTGYNIFREIIFYIFGVNHLIQCDAGWNQNEEKERF